MPVGYYDNIVRVVADNLAAVNAEIATQNAANYWLQNGALEHPDNVVLLFTKFDTTYFNNPAPQKFNEVDVDQTDIDADIAAEALNNYAPTGVFIASLGAGRLWILYQQVVVPAAP